MAYQALNIIGSFTAGVPFVQRDAQTDRDQVEAYRSVLREQVQLGSQFSPDNVGDVADRMHVGDPPHERRNPQLFLRYPRKEKDSSAEGQGAEASSEPGSQLDVVV